MYRIVVCDNDKHCIEKIMSILQDKKVIGDIPLEIKTYSDGWGLMNDCEKHLNYDIYILDIEMPNCSGIELAIKIKENDRNSIIIFVTAYEKYAISSYELSVFRFLPKMYLNERMPRALKDSFSLLEIEEGDFYTISTTHKFQKIYYKDILYIYKKQKNTIFVLKDEEISIRKSLKQVYEEIGSEDFIYIDRCYIVNIIKINKVFDQEINLMEGYKLPVSESHQKKIKQILNQYWGNRI